MRAIAIACAFIFSMATAAFAMSAKTAAFLKQIGIDPHASQVVAVENDVLPDQEHGKLSLDTLAAENDRIGIKQFIDTRSYYKAFLRDQNVKEPSDYRVRYLTAAEKKVMSHLLYCGMFPNDKTCRH